MAATRTIHSDLWRVFLLTLAPLFLIPAATLVFTHYALQTEDRDFIERIDARANAGTQLPPAQKAEGIALHETQQGSMAWDAAAA